MSCVEGRLLIVKWPPVMAKPELLGKNAIQLVTCTAKLEIEPTERRTLGCEGEQSNLEYKLHSPEGYACT